MKGWRTVGFNVLAAIMPFLQAIDVTDLSPQVSALYTGGVILGNIILRVFSTTTAIGKSE